MENTVILFAAQISSLAFEKSFGTKSAFELVLDWTKSVPDCAAVSVFVSEENKSAIQKVLDEHGVKAGIVSRNSWSKGDFASAVASVLSENKSDYGVIACADTPFLNLSVTKELIETHVKYSAEYTFSDGYPYGISPEIIDRGAAGIISALCTSVQKTAAEQPATRDSLFSIMSGDINSFEIETVISDKDYRLLRLEFEASSKINQIACKKLFDSLNGKNPLEMEAVELCDMASNNPQVLKTVPAFCNLQISSKSNQNICYQPKVSAPADMDFDSFKKLVSEIAEFSGKAVISLSAFGEPLLHPQFLEFVREVLKHEGLTLLIETDGLLVTEQLASDLSQVGKGKINWIVLVDAMDKVLYSRLHGCGEEDFEKALNAIVILEKYFENDVYPQFVRMKSNEQSLEGFYRFWKEKESPAGGQFIIQKYNSFCGKLSDEKSADLSPLDRNPCWHLRRDLTVLADGSVPLCMQCFDSPVGNVFSEGIENCWKKLDDCLKNHMEKNYSDCCGICDEHYTYNF